MTLLDGQTALVTGAGGGIGRAIALRFAQQGAAVAVHCRTAFAAATDVAERIRAAGGEAVVLRADLTDEAACRRLIEETTAWSAGRLTALVNNAAVQPVQPLPRMTAGDWRTVVDTDLTSVFACTQAAAAHMRAHGGGTITHIASIEAGHPAPGHAHYSAAKAAVVMHAARRRWSTDPTASASTRSRPGSSTGPAWRRRGRRGCAAGSPPSPPAAWAAPRTSPTRACSSPPRSRPGSPATTWWWTAE